MSDPTHSPVTKAFQRSEVADIVAAYNRLHNDSNGATAATREAQSATMAR